MAGTIKVLAHVLARNDQDTISRCIRSLEAQDHQHMEIVVSDNCSKDSTAEVVRTNHPGVQLVENRTNLGYAGGHNKIASRKGFDAFLALNADVFLEPTFVSMLVKRAFSDQRCGMATGLLLRAGNPAVIDGAGIYVDRFHRNRELGAGMPAGKAFTDPAEVFGAFGAAALYKYSMIRDLAPYNDGHLFDPDFFAYREEVDLAWRARQRGWTCLFEPGAVGYHEHRYRPDTRKSRPAFERRLQRRNRYFLLLKNDPLSCVLRDMPFILAYEALVFSHALLFEREILPAYVDALKSLRRMLSKRTKLRSFRSVKDTSICSWIGKPAAINLQAGD